MRGRRPWSIALAIALAGLALWRGLCVSAGPDVDTDAYAHHMIARAIAAAPRDLSVHWVWLPLFHYLQVPLVLLGGTMDDVRWANVALSAALPVVLYRYVLATARSGGAGVPAHAIAFFAAVVAAACPICMQMGTTAQPEPLFALLVLGAAIGFQRRTYGAAAALLGAAVLLRYEAWAFVAAMGAWLAVEEGVRRWRGRAAEPRVARAWAALAVPVLLVLAWAALRRPVDGRWFGFLRDTHEFAAGALHEGGGLRRGALPLLRDAGYYPAFVAARVLGPVLALVPFGVARTVRQQGARFVVGLAACLAFVSLSWITRSSLGLDRHFVVVVPLYATFAAQGVAAIADWGARACGRVTSGRAAAQAGRALAASLAVASVAGLGVELAVWMRFWRGSIERGWPERASLGAYLRSLPGSPTIFCDDATLEILSGLDRRRFDRHWIDDPHTWDLVDAAARRDGPVYVATWRRKLLGHEHDGAVVFAAGADAAHPDRTGVAVMRVGGDGGRIRR